MFGTGALKMFSFTTSGLMPILLSSTLIAAAMAAPTAQMKTLHRRQPGTLDRFNFFYHNEDLVRRDPLDYMDAAAQAVLAQYRSVRDPAAVVLNSSVDEPVERIATKLESRAEPIVVPTISSVKLLGSSVNDPVQQYINMPAQQLPKLSSNFLEPVIEFSLSKQDAFFNGSGNLELNAATQPYVKNMKWKPRFERDGGLGGTVNGHKLFIFADTQTYGTDGSWQGFASNSVGCDVGNNAFAGKPLTIQDKVGAFANEGGAMRNFIPFTTGEAAYNNEIGGSQRFGIWPLSSLISYGKNSSLLYAPIIWTNANAVAPANVINYVGTTLLKVTVPGDGGPVAERIAPMLWQAPGISWGAIGGIRKLSLHWPEPEKHGKIYIMGNNQKIGLMLGRVSARHVADPDAYEFWHADGTWDKNAPKQNSSDDFVTGAFSSVDIFYAPKYKTFIMTFMNPFADSQFYWRYLQSDHAIERNDEDDYVENITQYPWSEPQVMLQTPPGASYSYAGGVHRGYFEDDDITAGGDKMLVGWTQQAGGDPASGTALTYMTSVVTFA